MAELFNRLPGFQQTPAGQERTVLRLLPKALMLGTLLLCLPSLAVRLSPQSAASAWRSSGCSRTLTTSLRMSSFPLARLPEATRSARGANHCPAGGGATSSLYHKLDYPAT